MKLCLWTLILTLFLPFQSIKKSTLSIYGINYTNNKPVLIEFEKGKILRITEPEKVKNVPELFVTPGLIDMQINGFLGVDFSGPNLTVKDVKKATKALWSAGVTSYFPTIITRLF